MSAKTMFTCLNVVILGLKGKSLLLFEKKLSYLRIRLMSATTKDFMLKYSKTCVKRPLSKRPQIGFQDQLSLNAGQKHCRMLQGEHSAILSTFIKLPFVIMIFILSIFEWPFLEVLLCLI